MEMNPEAKALSAKAIYNRCSTAVGLLTSELASGSAVCIHPDGWFLTNYHVICGPLPISMKCKVYKDQEWHVQTYEDVQMISVHPEYDLALIKIGLAEGEQLQYLPIASISSSIINQQCYAIGNPSINATILETTITQGKVINFQTTLDDEFFIVFSAPVNPGNSGGALINDKGQLIGIVTYKIEAARGAGIAISVGHTHTDQFIAFNQRAGDPEIAKAMLKKGKELLEDKALSSSEEERQAMASYCFNLAIMEAPNSGYAYLAMGGLLANRELFEPAKAYLQKALECLPDDARARVELATVLLHLDQKQNAEVLLQEGAFNHHQAESAVRYGSVLFDDARLAEALYMFELGRTLGSTQYGEDVKKYREAKEMFQELHQEWSRRVSRGEFSEEEFRKLQALVR